MPVAISGPVGYILAGLLLGGVGGTITYQGMTGPSPDRGQFELVQDSADNLPEPVTTTTVYHCPPAYHPRGPVCVSTVSAGPSRAPAAAQWPADNGAGQSPVFGPAPTLATAPEHTAGRFGTARPDPATRPTGQPESSPSGHPHEVESAEPSHHESEDHGRETDGEDSQNTRETETNHH